MALENFGEKVGFIWSVADLLRGPYRPNQYKDVMLPLTVLRRLDCVLEPTKDKVLARYAALKDGKVKNLKPALNRVADQPFHNTSKFTFAKLKGDPDHIAANLTTYIKGFSPRAREIIEYFGFEEHIGKLDKADRLYLVVSKFCDVDLHPDAVSNIEMGYIFEELIRRFNEASNEEAGDHFTPREVIKLMVNLLFTPDNDVLTKRGIIKTLYDPACGTGGMLSVSEEYVRELNPAAIRQQPEYRRVLKTSAYELLDRLAQGREKITAVTLTILNTVLGDADDRITVAAWGQAVERSADLDDFCPAAIRPKPVYQEALKTGCWARLKAWSTLNTTIQPDKATLLRTVLAEANNPEAVEWWAEAVGQRPALESICPAAIRQQPEYCQALQSCAANRRINSPGTTVSRVLRQRSHGAKAVLLVGDRNHALI